MCEVTADNFEELFPVIKDEISSASFVAFDCEFTSLHPDPRQNMKNSLFDNMEQRYKKLTSSPLPAIISQIGLSIFKQLPGFKADQYEARSYNFFVCPRSFASVDHHFACQASSLEFLTRHGFDFNKFLYQGISSLNREQEARLRADLEEGALFRALDRKLPIQDEELVREVCCKLAAWTSSAEEGALFGPVDTGLLVPLVLHTEVRTKFPLLWSFNQAEGFFVVKVSEERRKELEADESTEQLTEQLVDSMLGFTKVLRHLSESGKPLVGHNCLIDLLRIFRQFETELPANYRLFKQKIHQLFPVIFDTKNICADIKKKVGRRQPKWERLLASSNLNHLFKELTGKSKELAHAPRLLIPQGFSRYSACQAAHEAGYDALLAGSCFLAMAHLLASANRPVCRPLSFQEKLEVLVGLENRVNVARAAVSHANLAGPDPPSLRPTWLHVSTRNDPLCTLKLAECLGRWGTVDVRRVDSKTALVAVGNGAAAEGVVGFLRREKDMTVARYNVLAHSKLARIGLWTSLLISVGLGLALMKSQLKSN